MARSLQQQLDDLDAAIEATEQSQAYNRGSFRQQRPLLATLYAERDRLEARIARANRSPLRLAKLNRARTADS
jgi:hypothetical protein